MSNLKGQPNCMDCNVLHGRDIRAALCKPCAKKREVGRRKSGRYRIYWQNYNRSPRGKIMKQLWQDKHAEKVRAGHRAAYARRKARSGGTRIWHCETLLCKGTFTRPRGSHRKFCTDCQRLFFGPAYALSGGRDSRGKWRKAA